MNTKEELEDKTEKELLIDIALSGRFANRHLKSISSNIRFLTTVVVIGLILGGLAFMFAWGSS